MITGSVRFRPDLAALRTELVITARRRHDVAPTGMPTHRAAARRR